MRIIGFLQSHKTIRNIVYKFGQRRARFLTSLFEKNLAPKSSIIDIGAGTCHIADLLIYKGYKVVPVDVINLSLSAKTSPIIYDGEQLPYKAKSFGTAILITVLHHTKNPKAILGEASRVSKQVVIIEDIYNNKFHKYLTMFVDSLLNFEFKDHPHTNKTDEQWKQLFSDMNLKLIFTGYASSYVVMHHGIYVLKT